MAIKDASQTDVGDVVKLLREYAGRAASLDEPLEDIGRMLIRAAGRNLDENRSPSGEALPPLKGRGSPLKSILGASGILDSLQVSVNSNEVEVYSESFHAFLRQYGARIPGMKIRARNRKALFWPGAAHPVKEVEREAFEIPARPFLGIGDEDLSAAIGIIAAHLLREEQT